MLKKADIGVGLYLLFAIVFFIVPIPSVLLDVMLAINISIALIILFNVLFVREVLDMSFFPTLLLFTTIFRISLNVSSTRLILKTGDPGNVVRTFGSSFLQSHANPKTAVYCQNVFAPDYLFSPTT